ncbi:hypothetical protein LPW26_03895 [Rhodopseudomonas sp. HC1]|uniref:hypothetical protein n=1 Tax=Rhodopseudomonas infernalis TaxID=2897386 RepID=UPI001EE93EC9|nr:hypothetical protein [Rhodopseudomonas infernalis]MCG6203769.1 hypothetical protein [Rhodopseudomonas infernalis]
MRNLMHTLAHRIKQSPLRAGVMAFAPMRPVGPALHAGIVLSVALLAGQLRNRRRFQGTLRERGAAIA